MEFAEGETSTQHAYTADQGWQKVTHSKKQRKQNARTSDSSPDKSSSSILHGEAAAPHNVFQSLELQAEERRKRILEDRGASAADIVVGNQGSVAENGEKGGSDDGAVSMENGGVEKKKSKPKKQKKPKETVADAASKIDKDEFTAFLADISETYKGHPEIQLLRFADYFGRKFSSVGPSQFSWVKILTESTMAKISEVPLSDISHEVYKASADWVKQFSSESLGSFVLWGLDNIILDLSSQQTASKGTKKPMQCTSSKSQVAVFVALAMVLRRKPDSVVGVLPTLRENSKYRGQEKLSLFAWMTIQVSQGDLAYGMYSWTRVLLPAFNEKSTGLRSKELIVQVVEKILSPPKSRSILTNEAVRKGERLVPPAALEILMCNAFPPSKTRTDTAAEKLEALYPTLKEIALAGPTASKSVKQAARQVVGFALPVAGEKNTELSKEAVNILIWCFSHNVDCYKQWESMYEDHLGASTVVLKTLAQDWKDLSLQLSPPDTLSRTLNSFILKNEKGVSGKGDSEARALYKEANKRCKALLAKVCGGNGILKGLAFTLVLVAIAAAIRYEPLPWEKISLLFNSQLSQ